tara:strand:+ start:7306 stop:7551 length:246 start_codon:yes stop_codon:yes gene_type:complete
MKLPATISIKYIGESDLPIMTVNSLHVITSDSDLNIIADYVSLFSSSEWVASDIHHAVDQCQRHHVFNVKNDDEWLSFSIT